ncbi:hypothetical protein GCM10010358_67270 [Streptomyces minutiscleroticus]|uniref:Transposase n=1 Tax=Streptomyces minutiscleroticus TaxID=68238 RepID=A0A918NXG1_9ACTN|nr:hypothetical protein GCM10010358_67270 [Streptomyces minutiscleroticus]
MGDCLREREETPDGRRGGGLDIHRGRITFDRLDSDSGQVGRGRIVPAARHRFRAWPQELPRSAVEGRTGWRFIVEECRAAGMDVRSARPRTGPGAGPGPAAPARPRPAT